MNTLSKTSSTQPTQSAEYPTLLRRGHRYICSLGQRLAVGGFRGPVDVSFGDDGWNYVLNRSSADAGPRPQSYYVPVTIKEEFGEFISAHTASKPDSNDKRQFSSPVMCEIDSDGILYSTDEHANSVVILSEGGEKVDWWGEQGTGPGQLNGPSGITFDQDENVWVVDSLNHRVQKFTRQGKYLGGWGEFGTSPENLNFPWGISVDSINQTLLVADWRNDLVKRFSEDGELLQVIGMPGPGSSVTQLFRPSAVTVDQHGDIYIVDRGNNRVLIFNHRGMFMESLIGDGTMSNSGVERLLANPDALRLRDNAVNFDKEKRFSNPTSVKVDANGRVFIVDTGRYRIQVYEKLWRNLESHEIDPSALHMDPEVY